MSDAELPSGWQLTTLGELGKWSSGGTPSTKRPEYYGGDVPWIVTGDLPDGLISEVPATITELGLENSSAKVFPPGTLLIAMYGATIGKLGVLRIPAATNQACAALIPDEANKTALPFIYQFLRFRRDHFRKVGKGGAQPNISQTLIKETPIPLPPLGEQRRIVEKIETLFARLDQGEGALRQVQKLLARYRQSVLKAAVTGELTADWRAENAHRLEHGRDLLARILQTRRETWQGRGQYKEPAAPDTTGLPDLPEGWVWASLDSLADHAAYSIVDGPFGSKLKTSHYTDCGVRVIRLENIGDGEFVDKKSYITQSHAEDLERHSVDAGDLVIASLGQQLPKACIVPDSVQRAIVKADCIRFSPYKKDVNGKFVLTWLNSLILRSRVEISIKGVGRPRLNLSDIRGFAVPFPDKLEQDEIVRIVVGVEEKISSLAEWCQTELTRSAALRQSILKDAFAGKLVPQDPADEPAAELLARIRASRAASPRRVGKAQRAHANPAS